MRPATPAAPRPRLSASARAGRLTPVVCADADLEAVQFFHKQGFRPVEQEDYKDVSARLAAHGIVEPTPSKLMFTSVENQLFVGQAREAEAQAEALGPELVGQRVEVFWSGEATWFPGQVASYKSQEHIHYVIYDDGESVWERLTAKDCKALGPGAARAQLDTTVCAICGDNGTVGPLYGPFDSNKRKDLHVHEHCIMYSTCVQLVGGALKGVGDAIASAKKAPCKICRKKGASVTCAEEGCKATYHYECCKDDASCHFQTELYEFRCPAHKPKPRRESARRASAAPASAGPLLASSAAAAAASGSPPRLLSPFGGSASFEMLAPAPAAPRSARKQQSQQPAKAAAPAVPAPGRPNAQNNGTSGGWTPREDRCLAAVMAASKTSSGASWAEVAAAVARSVDGCTRSENSCRHRWNKIAGVYKPTAAEKRRAQTMLDAAKKGLSAMATEVQEATEDRGGDSGASTAGDSSDDNSVDSHDRSFDSGEVEVRREQKVIVADEDESSDADNDVVEVVSVGADILSLPAAKPGYGYARAGTGAAASARGSASAAGRGTAAGGARGGSSVSAGRRVPHPPAPIRRSPATKAKEAAEHGNTIRRSGGAGGLDTRTHMVGSGGNCRVCRNGRGVCRQRGAPGHLEADGHAEKAEEEEEEEAEEAEEEGGEEDEEEEEEDESEEEEEEEPEPPTTRRRSSRT